ncbi:cytochrome biogenesis protein [Candidatus Endobugula sertula]|uniref:Cytochrome biogenesis protein n=1 Tax=Candidatus Endobugula sertula TaxID=62101 RepID=A0A1D2QRL7_9GAMM|nr:cytochrome biogenesis protein [Candidatus Endobugula sertula]
MIEISSLLVAFSIGILGGAHCLGMCGGIIGALTVAIASSNYRQRFLMVLFYNIGRILSYCFIAWIFYLFITQLTHYFALHIMRTVAGCLLIAMGLYLANWWRGLIYLEKVGSYLWRYIQPLGQSLLPVKTPIHALMLGMIWGWLPCGLIYSALVYSATAQNSFHAVVTMLAFALGTLPTVMASGLLAERLMVLIKQTGVRQLFAVLIIGFGVWTLWHSGHSINGI